MIGAQNEARDVEFMRCGIGDRHLAGEVGRRFHIPVEVMHHDRPAKRTVVERRLHIAIRRIEAAHETKLDEAAAARHFRLDNAQALLRALRQRLFAEHRLSGLDRGERQRCVGLVGAGNQHGVNVAASDGFQGVGGGIGCAVVLSHLSCPLR